MTFLKIAAALILSLAATAFAANKVLYVTHEPGRYHNYSDQLAVIKKLATESNWELGIATGSYDDTVDFLRTPDFGLGHDAIVYNFCFADSRDLDAMTNLIHQTVGNGVPALLIHCAMHSWWDTYKKGKPIPGNAIGKARASKSLLREWNKAHPDDSMPAWGDFTGVASTGHGSQKPIELTAVQADHPATARLPEGYATQPTELYDNIYITADTVPLLMGKQGKTETVVMWLSPRGKSQIIGLTLGHAAPEWEDPVFHSLLVDGVNFLLMEETQSATSAD